jgi:Flp pilus assembly protein TadG
MLVMVVIILPVLLMAVGWALDFGHVFVDKTRLQNAIDAAALSAAIYINKNPNETGNITNATAAGVATYTSFVGTSGNSELPATPPTFNYYSRFPTTTTIATGNKINGSTSTSTFVFVKVNASLNVVPAFLQILRPGNIAVPASATAGPVGSNCGYSPILLCANGCTNSADNTGCVNNFTPTLFNNVEVQSYGSQCEPSTVSAARCYELARMGNGMAGIVDAIIAPTTGCGTTMTSALENGLSEQSVQDSIDTSIIQPDQPLIVNYASYSGDGKRVVPVVVVNCAVINNPIIIANSCIFLNLKNRIPASHKGIYIQSLSSCPSNYTWNPTNAVLNGPYNIVLFKTLSSLDS